MSKPMRVHDVFEFSSEPGVYYVVTAREKFNSDSPEDSANAFAAVTSGNNSGWKQLKELDPKENPAELYHVVLGFEDGFDYYLKFPAGTNIHGLNEDKDVAFINAERSPAICPNEDYEMFLLHGDYPEINAVNNHTYSDTPKVYAEGWKYLFKPAGVAVRDRILNRAIRPRFIQRGGLAGMGGG